MLVAVHETNRILWAMPTDDDDPPLISHDPTTHVSIMDDIPPGMISDVETFMLAPGGAGVPYIRHASPPDDLHPLKLARNRCRASWSFARYLHQLRRSGQGYLPGLSLGLPNTPDGDLARQEEIMVNRMASELEDRFSRRLWTAAAGSEIVSISLEITMMLKRFQAYA